jgi:Uma2 family endonuclease
VLHLAKPAAAAARAGTRTVEDIFALPEGRHAELIYGEWHDMASPSPTHQDILAELTGILRSHIKAKGGACKALPSPFGVFLFDDDRTYVEPDISVVCDRSKIDDKGCHGAPDMIVEVVSPTSASRDYIKKRRLYERAGVREYWAVDPAGKAVTVFLFGQGGDGERGTRDHTFEDKVACAVLPGLEVDFAQVAGLLPP